MGSTRTKRKGEACRSEGVLEQVLLYPSRPLSFQTATTILKCLTETYLLQPCAGSFSRSVSSQSALTPSACSIWKVRQTRVQNAMFCFPSYNTSPQPPGGHTLPLRF